MSYLSIEQQIPLLGLVQANATAIFNQCNQALENQPSPRLQELQEALDSLFEASSLSTKAVGQVLTQFKPQDLPRPLSYTVPRFTHDLRNIYRLETGGLAYLNTVLKETLSQVKNPRAVAKRNRLISWLNDTLARAIYFAPHMIRGIEITLTDQAVNKIQGGVKSEDSLAAETMAQLARYFPSFASQPLTWPLATGYLTAEILRPAIFMGERFWYFGRLEPCYNNITLTPDIMSPERRSKPGLDLIAAHWPRYGLQTFRLEYVESLAFTTAESYPPLLVEDEDGPLALSRGSHLRNYLDFRGLPVGGKARQFNSAWLAIVADESAPEGLVLLERELLEEEPIRNYSGPGIIQRLMEVPYLDHNNWEWQFDQDNET